jgi:hypothetical protein
MIVSGSYSRGRDASHMSRKTEALFSPLRLIAKAEGLVVKEGKGWLGNRVVSLLRHSAQSRLALPLIAGYVSTNLKRLGPEATTPNPIRLLVLNEERYRADLEVLAGRSDVELYSLPSRVQHLVNAIWLSEARGISMADPDAYLHNRNPIIQRVRRRLHVFLTRLIGLLAKRHGFDGITSCTFYYRQDREWESAGHEIGVPFFALHKENMKDPVTHKVTIERYKCKGFRFRGDRLFLVNRLEKDVILKAGCAAEDRIAVVGALRMDTLYRRTRKTEQQNVSDKVVLFSTHHRLGLLEIEGITGVFNHRRDAGFVRHFTMLHGSFAKLAIEMPDTEFVIKAKWLGVWYAEIVTAIKEVAGVDPQSIPNLTITDSTPAQDLIDSAMVVVGLNSTTLLEAKLARVPVIIPLFEEAEDKYFASNVYFQKYMDVFAVASSPEQLCDQLRRAIDGQPPHQEDIPDSMVQDYLGYFDGEVADRVVRIMKQDIESARKRHARVRCEGE